LVAFNAWRATSPETNPNAPNGPGYVPQYKEPGLAAGRALDAKATAAFARGESQGSTADKYVRTTVLLASVLFLVSTLLFLFSLVQPVQLSVPSL